MRIGIAVYSTYTFSSRLLSGFLAYCREHPEVQPRIFRFQDGTDASEQLEDLDVGALVLGYRFRGLLQTGWRPGMPAIVQGFSVSGDLDFPQIAFNNAAIAAEAARRLSEEGLRQLLFVGNRRSESSPLRWQGFKEAGEALGLPVSFFGDGPSQRGQEKVLLKVQMADLARTLGDMNGPVGVFASDDNRGERVIEAAAMAGLEVPRDVAVVCVSSTPLLCDWTQPPLSAFNLDHEAQGRIAAEWAHQAARSGIPLQPHRIAPWRFVERASSSHLRQSDPLVAQALRYMEENLAHAPNIVEVARAAHTSKRTLERRFRTVLQRGPSQVFRDLRLKATLNRLVLPNPPLKVIAIESGWADLSQMGRAVKEATGLTPARYRLQFARTAPDACMDAKFAFNLE